MSFQKPVGRRKRIRVRDGDERQAVLSGRPVRRSRWLRADDRTLPGCGEKVNDHDADGVVASNTRLRVLVDVLSMPPIVRAGVRARDLDPAGTPG